MKILNRRKTESEVVFMECIKMHKVFSCENWWALPGDFYDIHTPPQRYLEGTLRI
jgi:hypothetical protein